MKLNKPPVSKEQSILEEYVEFLLVDKSNVHPIRSDIQAVLSAEPESISRADIAHKQEDFSEQNLTAQEKLPDTILGEKNLQEKTLDELSIDEKSVERLSVESISPDKMSENDSSIEKLISVEAEARVSKTIEQKSKFTEELPEEEQLKAWDALITQEKEQEFIEQQKILQQDSIEQNSLLQPTLNHEPPRQFLSTKKTHSSRQVEANFTEPKKESHSLERLNEYLPAENEEKLASVERLLAKITPTVVPENKILTEEFEKTLVQEKLRVDEQAVQQVDTKIVSQVEKATFAHRNTHKSKDIFPDIFQTLIFKVGKLPLAVPLLKLGGIIKISREDITPLVGTPSWFMGLIPNERGNLMVVNTQQYLMPEQPENNPDEYQYLIVLDDSNWALACHSVGDAKNLTHEDVRWSEKSSKRPWFAGMVVDYMSALIEVDELINLLAESVRK